MSDADRPEDVLAFWFGPLDADEVPPDRVQVWFAGSAEADAAIRARFGPMHARAASGALRAWEASARGRLALIVLFDQFSRQLFRGTPAAFASDREAARLCVEGIARGHDQELPTMQRAFFYMPLHHTEDRELQETSVRSFRALAAECPPALRDIVREFNDSAVEHADVIRRFGRFPHRNAILGRRSTAAEIEYLHAGGATYGQAPAPRRADANAQGADMSTSTVRVIASFAVRREHVDEFIRVARETLVAPTRAEPGCLRYDLWQDAADPTRFAMVEEWESAAALDTHLARESLRAAVARLTPMAAESPKVSRFRSVTDAS